jgi:hypothetical protein
MDELNHTYDFQEHTVKPWPYEVFKDLVGILWAWNLQRLRSGVGATWSRIIHHQAVSESADLPHRSGYLSDFLSSLRLASMIQRIHLPYPNGLGIPPP